MSFEGRRLEKTFTPGEDLDAAGCIYHAIALDDGKLAANGYEAGGILLSRPKSGEGGTLGYAGEMKFAAGGAVAAAKAVTVAASGWFEAASSGDYIVGRNGMAAVTSGSIGTGYFNFSKPLYAFSSSFAW
jgi:hypothetical protein